MLKTEFKMSRELTSRKGNPSCSSTLEDDGAFVECRRLENYKGACLQVKAFKCEHCNSTYTTKSSLMSHLTIHSRNKPFQCKKCRKTFAKHDWLLNHLRLHANEAKLLELEKQFKHLDESGVNCSSKSSDIESGVCRENLIENQKVQNYKGTHVRLKPFSCEKCSGTFTLKSDLERHLKIHSNEKPFQCMTCHEAFSERDCLARHLIVHTSKKIFKSEVTDQILPDKTGTDESLSTESEMSCENLAENQKLETSVRSLDHVNPLGCEKCNETLKSSQTRHLKIHSGECSFKCTICHKNFNRLTSLTRHISVIHSNKKLIKAEMLDNVFNDEYMASEDENPTEGSPLKCTTNHGIVAIGPNSIHEAPIHLDFNPNSQLPKKTPVHQKPFNCEKCHRAFAFKSRLIRHLRTHSGEKPFKCQTCGQAFSRNGDLLKHSRKHANEEGPLECEFSRKSSAFSEAPVNHLQIQENFCALCHKTFSDVEMLNEHTAVHINIKENDFICKICDKTFSSQQNITEHLKFHSNKKPSECENMTTHLQVHPCKKPFTFTCNICSKNFTGRRTLTKHLKRHADTGPVVCEVCHKRFTYRTNLISHMKTIHCGEKRLDLKCRTCHKTFSEKWRLRKHERVHSQEKPFQCEVCHKEFSQQGNLMTHIKVVHYGDKKHWECEVCHETFTQKASKLVHLRVHTGERPFECDVCGNDFSRKQHLTNHLRIHTGERPYHCETCSKNFVLKAHLDAHKKTHMKIDIKIKPLSQNYKFAEIK